MKKSIAIVLFIALLTGCGSNTKEKEQNVQTTTEAITQTIDPQAINVYYFHGKNQCKTCVAVVNVTQTTLQENFADNLNVKFIEVKTHEKENNWLVEKYNVTWNALIIAKNDDSIEITQQAFANAVNNPESLTELIKSEVNKRVAP